MGYRLPAKHQYAYRLDGIDRDWVQAGTRRYASYPNLAPGTYTFRVKSTNNDGLWSTQEAMIRLTITPAWWQTWWAYTLYTLGVILLGTGIVRYYRLRQSHRLLQSVYARYLKQPRPFQPAPQPAVQVLPQPKDPFKEKVERILEAHYTNPKFNVTRFAEHMALGTRELRRDIQQAYSKAPLKLIRDFRLKKAAILLRERTHPTIAEVAYAVGFSKPETFSQYFRAYFGENPSAWQGHHGPAV